MRDMKTRSLDHIADGSTLVGGGNRPVKSIEAGVGAAIKTAVHTGINSMKVANRIGSRVAGGVLNDNVQVGHYNSKNKTLTVKQKGVHTVSHGKAGTLNHGHGGGLFRKREAKRRTSNRHVPYNIVMQKPREWHTGHQYAQYATNKVHDTHNGTRPSPQTPGVDGHTVATAGGAVATGTASAITKAVGLHYTMNGPRTSGESMARISRKKFMDSLKSKEDFAHK